MSDESDPTPSPARTLTDSERLDRLEAWAARTARSLANHSAQFDRFSNGVREDLGQLYGGLLLVSADTTRIRRHLIPDKEAAGGELEESPKRPERARKQTPTDTFRLPGGVTLQASHSAIARTLNAWKGIKVLYYVSLGIAAAGGWILHFLHSKR